MAGSTRGTVTRLATKQAHKQETVRTESVPLNLSLSTAPSIINNTITALLRILPNKLFNNTITALLRILPNKLFTDLRAVILAFSSVLLEVYNTTWKTWKYNLRR